MPASKPFPGTGFQITIETTPTDDLPRNDQDKRIVVDYGQHSALCKGKLLLMDSVDLMDWVDPADRLAWDGCYCYCAYAYWHFTLRGPRECFRSGRLPERKIIMSSQFGHLFRISTWGESHGGEVGVVIDGCPPLVELSEGDVQVDLDRRKPGQSEIVTPRAEADLCRITSGVFEGKTLGTPICICVTNKDARPEAYKEMESAFRPSHADYTYQAKYGIRNWQGGGRASARETIGRVAAAAVAKKVLGKLYPGLEIVAYVKSVHEIEAEVDRGSVTLEQVESNIARCPNAAVAAEMIEFIKQIRSQGDSVGGVIECVIRNVPPGLGEPVFDKLEADLAKAMMSLPATKGFEIGSGFAGTRQRGSEHNDPFVMEEGRVRTTSNRSGGIQGGISNGEEIFFRIAFKPTATIFRAQQTVTTEGEAIELKARGRHDPCVLPRAVPMVEAMAALVLCDHALRHRAQTAAC